MDHRRRAADFSHLLETSCSHTTDCGSALESGTQEANALAQINNVNSRTNKSYNTDESTDSCSFKSTILAGHVAGSDSQRTSGSSYQTARTTSAAGGASSHDSSLESYRRLEVPSVMNRAITTEFSPQPELDLSETTVEPRTSGEMNKNIVSRTDKSSDESRDTNYNIKGGEEFKCTTKDQRLRSPRHKVRCSTPTARRMEYKDTRSLLTKLENMIIPSDVETPKSNQKMFRRLSQEFFYSPRTFTERLVTIIDESEQGCAGADTSGVDLSRMTKEFRKMCKFIQDESMPEMAPSLCMNSVLGKSRYPNDDIFADYERPATIVESPPKSPSFGCTPPRLEHDKKIYRKTPLNIFKNTCRENRPALSPGSPNSTRYFEYLEKQCSSNSPKLPAKNRQKPLRRSLSTSDISEEGKEVLIKSEEQLRSLEHLTTAEYETFDSHPGHEAREPNMEIPSSTIDNATAMTRNQNKASHLYAQSEEIDGDELSNSLLIEKELQRQRCFELATIMQQIEEEAKETNAEYPKALERHGIDPDRAFMKTISTCLDYKKCLSGMRQSSNFKRKKASNVDSGIDTYFFGDLYASSKKSFNDASVKNIHKQTHNYASTYKNPRPGTASLLRTKSAVLRTGATKKIDRNADSSDGFHQEIRAVDKRSPSVSPRRPGTYLRPAAKSMAYSKSPTRGKRSPTLQIPHKTRLFRSSERSRPPSKSVTHQTKSPGSKYLGDGLQGVSSVAYRTKSPGSKYLGDGIQGVSSVTHRKKSPESRGPTPSSRPSPTLRNLSKERVKEIGDAKSPKESPASAKGSKSTKYRFFFTPGRTPSEDKKKTVKTYFPSMDEHIYPESSQRIMKSLHAPGLYRLGYKTVISPISMYIHGTDMNLIHNIHERKNDMMLTPSKDKASEEKIKFKLATPRNSPLRNCRLLSDNEDAKFDDNDENIEEHEFALPKANYNRPAQVHTVNQSPSHIRGARTKGLLQSMQNRVVIRHQDKKFGKDEDNVPESCESDAPTEPDMSIHVLKSAEKTNFMGYHRMP